MKSKYVMISGLAFSEEDEMNKLSSYAKKGWILEKIVLGFFYKLKKDVPQDTIYSLDYKVGANEEYFNVFKEAGWSCVVSIQNQIHIFSAKSGTKPIYRQMDKYTGVEERTVKGTLYSLIIAMILVGLLAISIIAVKSMFFIILGLLMIDGVVFTFNFMPYLAYNSRIREIEQDGKCKNELITKDSRRTSSVLGVIFLVMGALKLTKKKYFEGVFCVMLGIYYYKDYKERL
ncbi:hypothetical protein Z968_04995 [Clostridium novyi A str. 4552]|uniref:DUF2812 domain-containing protein n=1 Tax=Clostridium novyi A str. 4552 TaxID=1444289 RepID=A0A0A0I690_CLONO|nr:DUF2812 domain-containing protein [Clostridium novyi]KGM96939.1 hypothetical protein Z968_04995 [Clostridium novyi A str. 4552]